MNEILNEVTTSARTFVHLHLHTSYSFLDGFNDPYDSAKRAKELGMTAMAVTDHNHLGGTLEFQKACKQEGIQSLLGVELYWTWDTKILSMSADDRTKWAIERAREDGVDVPEVKGKVKKKDIQELIAPYEYDTRQYHVLFIAANQTGWKNLVKLQSIAADRCTYNGRYLVDTEMLRNLNEGIIMTSACIGSPVNRMFIQGRDQEAYKILNEWHSIFGDRFFAEIQPLDLDKQWIANVKLIKWAKENNVRIVSTNDVHYTRKEDHDDHDTLLCIGIGRYKDETDRMTYSNDYWIKDYDEMLESFARQISSMTENDFPGKEYFDPEEYMRIAIEGLENTNYVASLCEEIKLGSDKPLFPKLEIPNGATPERWLTTKCYQNLYKYKKSNPEIDLRIYEARLQEELSIINPKGFAPYMLIVEEYIEWANQNDCPTGPGRGSAAGSLVLFLLGITKMIDPIKYNLLFFRFLTADRTSPPDVDTDFDYDNRYKVIEHLEDLYGHANVSHIGTYTVMGVKSSLKDVGRVLRIDFGIMNEITKKMDEILDKPSVKFKHFDKLKDSEDMNDRAKWQEFNKLENEHAEIFRLARRFEGTPRNVGIHASGILVTPMPVNEIVPTRKAKDGTTVTLFTGVQLEDLNFIKFDILGLKTISVIKNCLRHINEELSFESLYEGMDPDDNQVYEMVRRKETDGLFQIESNLFKGMIEDIKPDSLNDIIVINALGRPGPLSAGMPQSYAKRKHGEEEAVEPLRNTWDIVENTLGTIAYQEQLMLISQRVAGFNGNQADSYLRKGTAKKDKKKMALCKQWFVYGKINAAAPAGYDEDNKDQVMYDPEGKHGAPITGGINNGYDKDVLLRFWNDIEGYADYLFNLSHSACYSYITAITAHLKKYYPVQFMTALLTAEDKEEKVEKYIQVSESMGISVRVPDINLSGVDFTPMDNAILFGLGSVKGVGETSLPDIIANRPYVSIANAIERIPKKSFNKRVGLALIKSGAFDFYVENRYKGMNEFYDARKDKDDRYDTEEYNEIICGELEKSVLGAPITYKPWWDQIEPGEKVEQPMELLDVTEKTDRNGRLMAFLKLKARGSVIKGVMFSSYYAKNAGMLDTERYTHAVIKGKKDDKGSIIVSKASEFKPPTKTEERFLTILS
ncbi:DNA polymerase III subunit alpha [Bacillus atrophaeus]|uniref:DNA polymerase III subunit alpha n=1 Tax=Bacillus atrophaeus TaxID=1452 RepID=UPI002E2276EA|nr:DNA polymerase III subunit alpha [Bacillus atrophaeus]